MNTFTSTVNAGGLETMDSNNRPKIIMKAQTNPVSNDMNTQPVPPSQPVTSNIPQIDTNSPLAKGLPAGWSVEPPEMPIRRKGVK